jgi:curved DNA-binding protein CbpA
MLELPVCFAAPMESRRSGFKDYYATLGVTPTSTASDIKKAYRTLAVKFHPDRVQGGDSITASEKMIEINEAFSILSDERRKDAYDRELLAEHAPKGAASTQPPPTDWEIPVAPIAKHGADHSRQNSAVNQSVAQDFFDKLRLQVMNIAESAKMKEEAEAGWQWSLQGKTWGGNYWVSLRILSLLSTNTARELLKQIEGIIGKRRSGWKNNAFIFVIAFKEFQDSDIVLKLFRTYCLREENSVPRNMINIIVMDATQRRAVLCGKKSGDELLQGILHALGSSV